MALVIPNQYGFCALTYQLAGAARPETITFGFANPTNKTVAACNTSIRTVINSGSTFLAASRYDEDLTLIESYVLIQLAGVQTSIVDPTPLQGTSNFEPPPANVAVIVKKNTTIAGRQYRGRFFLPAGFIDESEIDSAGIINPGSVTSINADLVTWRTQMLAQNLGPVLLHSMPKSGILPIPTATPTWTVNNLVGTIKRRIRR